MRAELKGELFGVAAIIGIAWASFHIASIVGFAPTVFVAADFLSTKAPWYGPVMLTVWSTICGVATGLVAAFLVYPRDKRLPAGPIGVIVGVFALISYSFSGTIIGRAGEQAIRAGVSGIAATLAFALASNRWDRAAR
jgi:hypothetical protein